MPLVAPCPQIESDDSEEYVGALADARVAPDLSSRDGAALRSHALRALHVLVSISKKNLSGKPGRCVWG